MPGGDDGTVSRWISDLKEGDPGAAQPLWERYFARMVGLARAKLRSQPSGGAADEEDVALSAFDSFCAGVADGRFPRLADREDLWRILMVITSRKAIAQVRHDLRAKRGGTSARTESANSDEDLLARVIGREPTPEFAVMVAEEYEHLFRLLGDDVLRKVAVLRMEGSTNDEIAAQVGCARRTVARQLALIRQIWLGDLS